MSENVLDYSRLVDQAMQSVMRHALEVAAKEGLPGQHHFYLTLDTTHPEVEMSDSLRAEYPDEITIVLENQFWDLEIKKDHFSVTLNFGKTPQNLSVPFDAITAFVDPSVKFGLQFASKLEEKRTDTPEAPLSNKLPERRSPGKEERPETSAEVVVLDSFRNKD
jgi:hypothetical protein